MLLPGFAILLLFKYVPMYGVVIAFKDYNPLKGIIGSEWVGLKYFERFLTLPTFGQLFSNTVILSLSTMILGFLAPIILAVLINQVRHVGLKKNIQLIVYAPNFISTVIVCGMLFLILSPVGPVNDFLLSMGFKPINFMAKPSYFRVVYVVSNIWQTAGWSSIIYLATLSGVNPEFMEAARVDGANVIQRIIHIDLPTIKPISGIIFILSVGSIMGIGFEKAYLMQTKPNLPTSEILPTYLYKVGLQMNDYSYSTAVGLFNAAINVVLLLAVNQIVKKLNDGQGL